MSADPVVNDLREYEEVCVANDVRLDRIDQATTEALGSLTGYELLTALQEVDIDKVEMGIYEPGSVEDYFDNILLCIRAMAKGNPTPCDAISNLYELVWNNHKDLDIEPCWADE